MPPDVSTVNDDPPILSDREFLEVLAGQVTEVKNLLKSLVRDGDVARDLARMHDELTGKQLDHIDTMCHETAQFIEEHRPALAKALAFLSPGRSLTDYFKRGKAASDGTGT